MIGYLSLSDHTYGEKIMMVRWRHGRLQYRTGRSWQPSRVLRFTCRIGLHFMAFNLMEDRCRCECGRQYLNAENITNPQHIH